MRNKLLKMLDYIDLIDESKRRERNIKTLPFYQMFGLYEEQKDDLNFQKQVTERLENRLLTLKKEL